MNSDVEWLMVSSESGSGNDTITTTYMDNPNTVERYGTLTITGGGINRDLKRNTSGAAICSDSSAVQAEVGTYKQATQLS